MGEISFKPDIEEQEKIDFTPIDFVPYEPAKEPESQEGHWQKQGLTTMWKADKPVDIEARPDNRTFEFDELPGMVKHNLTHNPIANRFPKLAGIAASMVGGADQFILDSLGDPTLLAGAKIGLGRAKAPSIPKASSIPGSKIPVPEVPKAIPGMKGSFDDAHVDDLMNRIKVHPELDDTEKIAAQAGLARLILKQVPDASQSTALARAFGEKIPTPDKQSWPEFITEVLNLPRSIGSSMDLSFPFRQGLPLIHTKAWWTSWDDMVKSLGSEKTYRGIMDSILDHPYFKTEVDEAGKAIPSLADSAGLKLTDLRDVRTREEHIISGLAERAWGIGRPIRASNRAYNAFGNKLRSDVFISMVDDAKNMHKAALQAAKTVEEKIAVEALNPETHLPTLRGIADYINTASGRASLKGSIKGYNVDLEKHALLLTNIFYAPRLMASRLKMLNPATYIFQTPQVRKAYLKSAASVLGFWGSIATLGHLGGADVVLDPTNSDFMKIRMGNTRLDPGAGFQQYLVLMARMGFGGTTSSSKPNAPFEPFGEGYGSATRMSTIQNFAKNKTNPVIRYIWGALEQSKYRPFNEADEAMRLFAPMITQDIIEVAKDDPKAAAYLTPLVGIGMGVQTYGQKREATFLGPGGLLGNPFNEK